MDEQPTLDTPGILLRLLELEDIVMAMARDRSRGLDFQLHAVVVAHKLHLDRLLAIEMRDVQQGQRHLDSAFARRQAERERWD